MKHSFAVVLLIAIVLSLFGCGAGDFLCSSHCLAALTSGWHEHLFAIGAGCLHPAAACVNIIRHINITKPTKSSDREDTDTETKSPVSTFAQIFED